LLCAVAGLIGTSLYATTKKTEYLEMPKTIETFGSIYEGLNLYKPKARYFVFMDLMRRVNLSLTVVFLSNYPAI